MPLEVDPFLAAIKQGKHIVHDQVEATFIADNKQSFTKRNKYYEVKFEEERTIIKAGVGEQYIEHLLKNYNKELFCLDLLHRINPLSAAGDKIVQESQLQKDSYGDAFNLSQDFVISSNELDNYRKKLRKLQECMENAEETGDIDEYEKLKQDRDFLLKEINANTDIQGKPRKFSTDQEKARKAVSKAIARAKNSLKSDCPRLYEHLMTYLSIGNVCIYQPTEKIKWD